MTESKEVVAASFGELIDKAKPHFLSVAPGEITLEAEKEYAMQLLSNNEYLRNVAASNQLSFFHAIKNVASIGLSLNPAKKQAYLIPRSVKIGKQYVNKVFLEPSYIGMCDVATASGDIQWVQARCVYANDTFIDNGVGDKPTHQYNAFEPQDKRGNFIGVYCVAKTKEGDFLTTLMDREQVESIRDRSEAWKAGQYGPWKSDFEEMAKKAVIRQAFKTWPKTGTSERIATAVHISNENEGFEPIHSSPEVTQFTAEQKNHFDWLISNNDEIGMFIFLESIPQGVHFSLYNSFEKGKIGEYKKLVDRLHESGKRQIINLQLMVEDATQSSDDLGIKENLEDLRQETIDWLLENLAQEPAEFLRLCIQEGVE